MRRLRKRGRDGEFRVFQGDVGFVEIGVGGEDLAEGGEGLVPESGNGFERDVERGNDVGNNTLNGGDEV